MVTTTKTAAKAPATTKVVEKKAPAVKPAAKPVAKKVAPAKKPVSKKAPAKKPAKKVVAKKPVAKKVVAVAKPVVAPVAKPAPVATPVAKKAFKKERNIFVCYANAFKKYFDFKGRTSRWGYWSFVGVNFVISFIFGALAVCCVPYIDTAYSLLVFIPGLAVSFRRLHDVNKSGWWVGVPMFFMIVAAILAMTSFFKVYVNPEYIDPSDISTTQIVASLSYSFIVLVSCCLLLYVFVLSFFKGTKGKNKYGEEPNV